MNSSKQSNKWQQFAIDFLMGGFAASISKTIASPIEVIKIRLQLQYALLDKKLIDVPYQGVYDCFKRLYIEEGLYAYYKGNLVNVIRYFPTQALNFSFKDMYKRIFNKNRKNDSHWASFATNVASGSAAGASTQFFVYPLDYTRTRLTNNMKQSNPAKSKQYQGIIDCIRQTYNSDGYRGLYRGFAISCICMTIYRGAYFGLNDTFKLVFFKQSRQNVGYAFMIGYLATVVGGLLSYPFDTIRRRMMMSSGEKIKFKSSIQCAKQIMSENGIRSFFGGVSANILRGITGAGVLTLYDQLQLIFLGTKYSSGES